MSRKFITNPWTKVPHGHARTELILLKDLMNANLQDCSIISDTEDFGDIFLSGNDDAFIESKIFNMNPLYTIGRFWKIQKSLKATLEKFRLVSKSDDDLIFSSVNFEQFIMAAVFFRQYKLSIRVFNCPSRGLSKFQKILVKKFLKTQNFRIGTETKEIANWFKDNLDIRTQIVPPLNRLRSQGTSRENTANFSLQRSIGVFYPVTSSVIVEELQEIINIFRDEEVKVKFPTSMPKGVTHSGIKTINNGISDDELSSCIKNLDAVILMNHNYVNRGSGLLTLCMSLGKIIYVFDDNNFVNSYKEIYPLINVQNTSEIAEHYKINGFVGNGKEKFKKIGEDFVEYVNTSWETFLDVR
jgi:hypothetical protein